MRLQQYEFTIIHREGEGNPADLLSRQPLPDTNSSCGVADQYINFMERQSVPKTMSIEQIALATREDTELQEVSASIQSGRWDNTGSYYAVRHELSETENGLILRGTNIVMPKSLQPRTLELAHKGHQGIVKTKQHLRTKVWWTAMDKSAEQYVKQCHACQSLSNGDPPPPLQQVDMPQKPWSRLHMDFCGPYPTGETLLVVIDAYSRFPEVEVLKSTTAKVVTKRLDRIFAVHGLPNQITSDNGPPFDSKEMDEYMKRKGIKHHRVTPLWPQANGTAESFMKPLGKSIKAAKIEGKEWKEELYEFLLAYRTTPHTVTGVAPASLLFNRDIRTSIPSAIGEEDLDYRKIHKQAQQNVNDNRAKAKQYVDQKRHSKTTIIKVGDEVLVKQSKTNKFTPKFNTEPLIVTEMAGTKVTAKWPDQSSITRNVSHFKKFQRRSKNDRRSNGEEMVDDELDYQPELNEPPNVQLPPRRYPNRERTRPRFFVPR